jgi:hypothetical protein
MMQTDPPAPWRNMLLMSGLFLTVAGSGWLMLQDSRSRSSVHLVRGDPGPFFLAELCLAVICAGGLALLVAGGIGFLRRPHNPIATTWSAHDALRLLVPGLFVVTLLVLPLAMRTAGTPLALGLFALLWIFVLMFLSGARGAGLALGPLLGALGTGGFIQIVFIRLLSLPLPT